jgi:hypothetical protein
MSDDKGICYCGRPMERNQHSDGGDPEWCYPEEAGLDDESRCNAMLDPDAEGSDG